MHGYGSDPGYLGRKSGPCRTNALQIRATSWAKEDQSGRPRVMLRVKRE